MFIFLYARRGCRKGYVVVKTAADMIGVSVAKNAHSSMDVIKIKCSPDGKYVATSGFDGFVHVWRFPHLELVCSHQEPFCSKVIVQKFPAFHFHRAFQSMQQLILMTHSRVFHGIRGNAPIYALEPPMGV